MGAKRVSKQGVTVSEGNAIEVTNTAGTALFSVNSTGNINTLANLTAKGSILTASAANTPAALAVGNAGETLVADSSTSTGLRYQPVNNGNFAPNGGFDIWQRGTSFAMTASELFTADRWFTYRGGFVTGGTVSRQTSGVNFTRYSLRLQRDSGNTSTQGLFLDSTLETQDSIGFAGQTVTFSFYAKAGANYSGSDFRGRVLYGTGTDQRVTSFTGVQVPLVVTATGLSTSWQRFQGTTTINAAATEIGFDFAYTPSGTAGANDWVEITGVQFEVGSIATTFKRAGVTLAGEYAAACRYYYRQTENPSWIGNGFCNGTTLADIQVFLPVLMRTSPSITFANGTNFFGINFGSSSVNTNTVSNIYDAAPRSFYARFTTTGLTNGFGAAIKIQNASAYWEASAEL